SHADTEPVESTEVKEEDTNTKMETTEVTVSDGCSGDYETGDEGIGIDRKASPEESEDMNSRGENGLSNEEEDSGSTKEEEGECKGDEDGNEKRNDRPKRVRRKPDFFGKPVSHG
ncbi:hypothetical protein BpHYR1_033850, partial [Brachionus plicatilis]